MKGCWIGYYQYFSKSLSEKFWDMKTGFTIEIHEVDGFNFKGMVKDDIATGGMYGEGTIIGKMKGRHISFVKKMPIETLIMSDGSFKTTSRKHPKIYYKGYLAQNGNEVEGVWKIKTIIIWKGLWPFIIPSSKGNWYMKREDK